MTRQNPHHLARGWESFARAALNASASATQREAMRDAFYAGAMVAFATLVSQTSEGDAVTPDDMYLMADIDAEIEDFGRSLRARSERSKAASS